MRKCIIPVLMVALLSSCGQQKKSNGTDEAAEKPAEELMEAEAIEDMPDPEARDYLARCNCSDCDDYILIMDRQNYQIARYYLNGQFSEFDVERIEYRIVDISSQDETCEYIFINDAGDERVVLYVNSGMDRDETVIYGGIDRFGSYFEMRCLGADVFEQGDSPNIDTHWFPEIGYEDKGYGLWNAPQYYNEEIDMNYVLMEVIQDNMFVDRVTLRGKDLYLVDGDQVNSYTDYDITFQMESSTGANTTREFTGPPSITTYFADFGVYQEILDLRIEDTEGGLDYILSLSLPQFDEHDTTTVHYSYEPVYYSRIRSGYQDFKMGESYTDTLMLVEYDDNYDYEFAIFLTRNGDQIHLICSDYIDNEYQDRVFAITWEFGTFSEAGEGETPYTQEHIISWELTDLPPFEFDNY